MKLTALMTAAIFSGVQATVAWSADYQVKRILQLSSSASEAWHLVGDFCDIDDWHPAINACSLKVIDGRLHRVLTTADGANIVEMRIAAEPGLSYSYTITNSAMPIERYTATLSVEPNDGTLISWSGSFTSDDPAMEAAIAEMYESGLSAIKSALADQ